MNLQECTAAGYGLLGVIFWAGFGLAHFGWLGVVTGGLLGAYVGFNLGWYLAAAVDWVEEFSERLEQRSPAKEKLARASVGLLLLLGLAALIGLPVLVGYFVRAA